MKKYIVTNRFSIRDSEGRPTGSYADPKQIIELSDREGARLVNACCVRVITVPLDSVREVQKENVCVHTAIETASIRPDETRKRRGKRGKASRKT